MSFSTLFDPHIDKSVIIKHVKTLYFFSYINNPLHLLVCCLINTSSFSKSSAIESLCLSSAMAALRDSLIVLEVVMAMAVAQFFGFTHGCWSGCPSACPPGVQYQVGGSVWSIPPSPHYYTNWSSAQSFRTGDSLRNSDHPFQAPLL